MASNSLLPPSIETADIDWQQGVPVSRQFGDVYYSRDDGLAETRYVFIGSNGLVERFKGLATGSHFVVAETGFGTGLNFLACYQAWEEAHPDSTSCLHFVSVERYPLTREDLANALSQWPQLKPLAEELISVYPPPVRGVHRRLLGSGRIRLTLIFGDAQTAFGRVNFKADAWFLDGFAPTRNPNIWANDVIQQIAEHCRPGATLATFTASGHVRRALIAHGFDVQKVAGFGRKRDMLTAVFRPTDANFPDQQTVDPGHVAIIGSGIAGATLAANLSQRGVAVTLIDRDDAASSRASGNTQGALYVKLGVEYNDQTALALNALLFSQSYYRPFIGQGWHPTGLIQLAHNDVESQRQQKFLARNHYPSLILKPVTSERATTLAGVPVPHNGLWFPDSGWLNPSLICEKLVENAAVHRRQSFNVRALTQIDSQWHIESTSGDSVIADKVVLCAGFETQELVPESGTLRMKPIRGQVTTLRQDDIDAPDVVLCGPGYINPLQNGRALVGATFDLHDHDPEVSSASHKENLTMVDKFVPGLLKRSGEAMDPQNLTGRVSFRSATFDYQPVAGPFYDKNGESPEGLYLFTGLGSKGLTYAPLLAEFLADHITGQPQCLEHALQKRVTTHRLHDR